MKLAFVMDPIEEININKDSTFAIMLAARKRNFEVWYALPEKMWAQNNDVFAELNRVEVTRGNPHFKIIETKKLSLAEFSAVFMRKDPPFDMEYIHATYQLSLIKNRTKVINDPDGIRTANEKVFILNYPDLITETIVTKDRTVIKDFLVTAGGKIVLKPLDRKGGEGIFILDQFDKNTAALIDISTNFGKISVMAQKYIPEAVKGDKRIIIINGEPLGAILRVPSETDHRGNLCAGAKSVSCEISARELEICERLKPDLLRLGLTFVGIDILGDFLSEINVTSPTGLQEIASLYGTNLEENILDLLQ